MQKCEQIGLLALIEMSVGQHFCETSVEDVGGPLLSSLTVDCHPLHEELSLTLIHDPIGDDAFTEAEHFINRAIGETGAVVEAIDRLPVVIDDGALLFSSFLVGIVPLCPLL